MELSHPKTDYSTYRLCIFLVPDGRLILGHVESETKMGKRTFFIQAFLLIITLSSFLIFIVEQTIFRSLIQIDRAHLIDYITPFVGDLFFVFSFCISYIFSFMLLLKYKEPISGRVLCSLLSYAYFFFLIAETKKEFWIICVYCLYFGCLAYVTCRYVLMRNVQYNRCDILAFSLPVVLSFVIISEAG